MVRLKSPSCEVGIRGFPRATHALRVGGTHREKRGNVAGDAAGSLTRKAAMHSQEATASVYTRVIKMAKSGF